MLVWLGQAVNSSALLIKTKRTAAFFNATIGISFNVVISGEGKIITLPIADCRLPIADWEIDRRPFLKSAIGNRQSQIGNYLNQPIGRPERSTQTLLTCV